MNDKDFLETLFHLQDLNKHMKLETTNADQLEQLESMDQRINQELSNIYVN